MTRMGPLVEVRLPTYSRPTLLARAISSLQEQTWHNWRCDVYDDSSDNTAQIVCEKLKDSRISYHRNSPRRYAAENIDAAFTSTTLGADYAFVLEDDNYLLPQFIEANIDEIGMTGAQIVLRNQFIENESGDRADRGVLDVRFAAGVYEPLEFIVAAFFCPIVSNGGLFWSRDAVSQLRVGHVDCGPIVQEYMRGLVLREKITVAQTPLAVWTDNGVNTTRNATRAGRREHRVEQRSIQLIRQSVYDAIIRKGLKRLISAGRVGNPQGRRERGVVEALRRWPGVSGLSLSEHVKLLARGSAIRTIKVTSSLTNFLEDFGRYHN